jgi:hypothetical protein
MGIIVSDEQDIGYGVAVSNCYVNVFKIEIMKPTTTENYTINSKCRYFVSEEQRRLSEEKHFREVQLTVYTDNLDDIYTQVYTELKTNFENYTDCI